MIVIFVVYETSQRVPNKGIKKLLQSKFCILDVNEFNTSKLYNKTFEELTNVSVKRKKHHKRLHEILTPKEEPKQGVFINRDVNACKNILYLGKYYLQYRKRPKEFQRKVITKEPKKKISLVNKKVTRKKTIVKNKMLFNKVVN